MRKKKNKKIVKFIKLIGVLIIIALIIYILLNKKISNIYVKGNKILSDQEIIELAGLENYPKIYSISISKTENKIKLNQVIESVKVRKNIFGRIDIKVSEYNMLLKNEVDNTVYLSNGKNITLEDKINGIPSLINIVSENVLTPFLKKLDNVDKDILSKISEIEYKPSIYDKELFLFYMNDGNYVYININRLLNINKYESMLEQLEGKKGILYLDSGNHFEVLD